MSPFQQILLCTTLLSSLISTSWAQPTTFATAVTTAISPSQTMSAPSCAASCINKATGTQSCAPGDQSCLCSASTQIQESIAQCLTTTSCSESDTSAAIDYYPEYCRSLNLAVETDIPTMIVVAGGNTATRTLGTGQPTVTVHSGATQTTTVAPDGGSTNANRGLALPAILGITLAVLVVAILLAALVVWSVLRRRHMRSGKGPRMDLGDEFVTSQPRPARSKSVESDFMVQPSPVEKDEFGPSLSRTSTLVPPPPVAKDDDKRTSEQKRNSARNKALNLLLGTDKLRASFLSGRSSTKQRSLIVPPLNITKQQEEDLRVSKF